MKKPLFFFALITVLIATVIADDPYSHINDPCRQCWFQPNDYVCTKEECESQVYDGKKCKYCDEGNCRLECKEYGRTEGKECISDIQPRNANKRRSA